MVDDEGRGLSPRLPQQIYDVSSSSLICPGGSGRVIGNMIMNDVECYRYILVDGSAVL